jgi:hypothetical protein
MRSRTVPLDGMLRDVNGAPDASSPGYLDVEPKSTEQLQHVGPAFGQRSRVDEVGPEPVGAGHRRNLGNLDRLLGQVIIEEASRRGRR